MTTSGVTEMQPLQITVANGKKVQGTRVIKGFTWTMEGHTFAVDVILFPLVGCDMILGMQWLKTLDPTTWNCSNLTVEFMKNRQKVTLTACKGTKNQLPELEKEPQ